MRSMHWNINIEKKHQNLTKINIVFRLWVNFGLNTNSFHETPILTNLYYFTIFYKFKLEAIFFLVCVIEIYYYLFVIDKWFYGTQFKSNYIKILQIHHISIQLHRLSDYANI